MNSQFAEISIDPQGKQNVLIINDDGALLLSFKIMLKSPTRQVKTNIPQINIVPIINSVTD